MLAIQRMAPRIPFAVLALLTVGFITLMTVQGIKFTARTNEVLLGFMVLVTTIFLVEAFRYIVLHRPLGGLFSMQAGLQSGDIQSAGTGGGNFFGGAGFYRIRRSFDSCGGSEESETQRAAGDRAGGDFHRACSAACRFIWRSGSGRTTQRCKIQRRHSWTWRKQASGPMLFAAYGVMLLVSSIACGLAGHVGAARLLYSMGRDDVLPKKIFGHLSLKKSNPIYNIWIVGGLAYIAVLTIPWELAAEVVTFGALIAFMGVNLAAMRHFWFSPEAIGKRNFFIDAFVPGFGLLFCFILLLSLQIVDKICGAGVAGRWDCVRGLHDAWIYECGRRCLISAKRRAMAAIRKTNDPPRKAAATTAAIYGRSAYNFQQLGASAA